MIYFNFSCVPAVVWAHFAGECADRAVLGPPALLHLSLLYTPSSGSSRRVLSCGSALRRAAPTQQWQRGPSREVAASHAADGPDHRGSVHIPVLPTTRVQNTHGTARTAGARVRAGSRQRICTRVVDTWTSPGRGHGRERDHCSHGSDRRWHVLDGCGAAEVEVDMDEILFGNASDGVGLKGIISC